MLILCPHFVEDYFNKVQEVLTIYQAQIAQLTEFGIIGDRLIARRVITAQEHDNIVCMHSLNCHQMEQVISIIQTRIWGLECFILALMEESDNQWLVEMLFNAYLRHVVAHIRKEKSIRKCECSAQEETYFAAIQNKCKMLLKSIDTCVYEIGTSLGFLDQVLYPTTNLLSFISDKIPFRNDVSKKSLTSTEYNNNFDPIRPILGYTTPSKVCTGPDKDVRSLVMSDALKGTNANFPKSHTFRRGICTWTTFDKPLALKFHTETQCDLATPSIISTSISVPTITDATLKYTSLTLTQRYLHFNKPEILAVLNKDEFSIRNDVQTYQKLDYMQTNDQESMGNNRTNNSVSQELIIEPKTEITFVGTDLEWDYQDLVVPTTLDGFPMAKDQGTQTPISNSTTGVAEVNLDRKDTRSDVALEMVTSKDNIPNKSAAQSLQERKTTKSPQRLKSTALVRPIPTKATNSALPNTASSRTPSKVIQPPFNTSAGQRLSPTDYPAIQRSIEWSSRSSKSKC